VLPGLTCIPAFFPPRSAPGRRGKYCWGESLRHPQPWTGQRPPRFRPSSDGGDPFHDLSAGPGSLVGGIGHGEQDVNDGLGRQPWHRGRTDLLDLDGATAERGADASSLAGEKLRQ
jgi:hypothetical protein